MRLAPLYPLRTGRLALRPLSQDDAPALVRYRSIPEVCRYVPFEPMTIDDIRHRIAEKWSRTAIEQEGEALTLGVELAASGELIGDVMFFLVSVEHRCGEVGYVFDPSFSGQGFATEAVSELLRLGFDELGLHRMIARVDARNGASSRVLLRAGMRLEAHLHENEWFKGEWSDELDYAILEDEWRNRRTGGSSAPRKA